MTIGPAGRADVVVLGEALWDLFPVRAGEPLATRRLDLRRPGGGPANAARTLARLGIGVRFLGAVGRDPLGDGLVEAFRAAGVGVESIVRVPARTGIAFVDLAEDGSRRFVSYRSAGADFALDREAVLAARGALACRWLLLGSSAFAREPNASAAIEAIALSRAQGAKIALDLNVYPHLWERPLSALDPLLLDADLVKTSAADRKALDLDAESLAARRGGKLTVATSGPAGATCWSDGDRIVIPPRPARAIDPTGAGDAFVAGLLAGLVVEESLEGSLALAAELGARATEAIGATDALEDLAVERARLAERRAED
jgi:fructokinase